MNEEEVNKIIDRARMLNTAGERDNGYDVKVSDELKRKSRREIKLDYMLHGFSVMLFKDFELMSSYYFIDKKEYYVRCFLDDKTMLNGGIDRREVKLCRLLRILMKTWKNRRMRRENKMKLKKICKDLIIENGIPFINESIPMDLKDYLRIKNRD